MNIVIVAGLAGPDGAAGGVWTVAETQKRALEDLGHEVTLVGGWLGPHPPSSDRVRLVRLRQLIPRGGLRFLISLKFPFLVSELAKSADIVHVHLARDFVTTVSSITIKKPIVFQAHGMIRSAESRPLKMFDMIFKRAILRKHAMWLALTENERTALESYGVNPNRIRPIPNAVRLIARDVRATPRVPLFGFISRFHPRKRVDVFCKAAIKVAQVSDARFFLAGPDQGSLSEARNIIAGSMYAHRFVIAGPLSSEAVREHLGALTALVLPSQGEVAPMIAIEAAAAGTPLVLTRDCGLASAFEDANAAFIVDPEVNEVARAMEKILDDDSVAVATASRGLKLVETEWSAQSMAASLLDTYGTVIGAVSR